ncbi:hypothetical protein D8S82_32365 [Mycobacterium hodleri]|uniref:Uncharacterized protein n=1 Tax=Mycolicibacterium hodleri TaxID=49897 RepID=A0A544VQW5_9MYCO|nr:hypothetical protein [Mycolicibacterium hodleri]TQR82385.1 hypothetical protein D8S82_32365 [Mycolicibacterium hodleri]
MTHRVSVGAALRAGGALLVVLGVAAFVLVGCPSYRDGIPGELARGRDDAESAARSAALALDLWGRDRSTRDLASVQLSDARDEVAKAYKDVAELTVDERVDADRQRFLIDAMTRVIVELTAAHAAVRAVPGSANDPDSLRRDLLSVADQLAGQYR